MSIPKLLRASHLYLSQTLTRNHINTTAKTLSPFLNFHGLSENSELRTPAKEVGLPPESESISESSKSCAFQISHPWPEWIDLMECLLTRGYFSGDENPFRDGELGRREASLIQTACLNFSRDRFDIIWFLSEENISVIAARGCPNLEKRVVTSAKRLRSHINVDEGQTCSSCNLKEDCRRAYIKEREGLGGRTVDVMRILTVHGLDSIPRTGNNKQVLNKALTRSVRILLKEIVECSKRTLESNLPKIGRLEKVTQAEDNLSSQENSCTKVPKKYRLRSRKYCYASVHPEPGDWQCPKCDLLNFQKNIKCLYCGYLSKEKLQETREQQEKSPKKIWDWICDKCKLVNVRKNRKCMLCDEPRIIPRKIIPGDWECPLCDYINPSRNMVCFSCDYKKPKMSDSSYTSSDSHPINMDYRENRRSRIDRCDGAW